MYQFAKRAKSKIADKESKSTVGGMLLSESSLKKDWGKEDNNYWESFLKKKQKKQLPYALLLMPNSFFK